VFDALSATRGEMYAVSNDEALNAGKLFRELEGIDLDPAAAVCVASFIRACEDGRIDERRTSLLNITGGGYERVREDFPLIPAEPGLTVPAGSPVDIVRKELLEMVNACV
jgi:cysteate synthase